MRDRFRVQTFLNPNLKMKRWYRKVDLQYKDIFIIYLCVYYMNNSKMRRAETNRVRISYGELPLFPVWFCAKYLKVSNRTQAWKLVFKIFHEEHHLTARYRLYFSCAASCSCIKVTQAALQAYGRSKKKKNLH